MGTVRLALSWMLLAACYSPSPETGLPCDLASPSCPRGQTCIAFNGGSFCEPDGFDPTIDAGLPDGDVIDAPDAPPDAPAGPDTDNDTIADSVDNCPAKANKNQANEDGDAWGDVCDPCPPIAETTPDDPDGDSVSNFCDTFPNMPGESIYLFEGFRDGLPATWSKEGAWTPITSGGAYSMSINVANTEHASLDYPQPPGNVGVLQSIGFVVTASNTGTQYSAIGPVAYHVAATDSGIMCGVASLPNDGPRLSLINTAAKAVFQKAPYEMVVGTAYSAAIVFATTGIGYICEGANGVTAPVMIQGQQATNMQNTKLGVRVQGAGASLGWVLVVTTPI